MPRFLISTLLLAIISLMGFGFVVLNLSPDETLSVAFFLITLFLGLVSTLSLAFFLIRRKFFFHPRSQTALGPVVIANDLRPLLRTSFRYAIMVAALLTIFLVLQRFL